MRVLLTGASGFIGSSLQTALETRGHTVIPLLRPSAARYQGHQTDVIWKDMTESAGFDSVMVAATPEVVVNLAALSAVDYSFSHPEEVWAVNCLGALSLARALRRFSSGRQVRFIHASTSEVYGQCNAEPIPETAPLHATSPYAASKIAAEYGLRQMQDAGLALTIMRPFNSYGRANVGSRQFVIERAITEALEAGSITLQDSAPIRDLVWREDHVRAYVLAVEDMAWTGKTVNIATGTAWSIAEAAILVQRTVARVAETKVRTPVFDGPFRPADIAYLCGDNKTAYRLGWEPTMDLAGGLELATREWMQRLKVREASWR